MSRTVKLLLNAAALWLIGSNAIPAMGQVNVTMNRYNLQQNGLNASETILTPKNVTPSTFGVLFHLPVDSWNNMRI